MYINFLISFNLLSMLCSVMLSSLFTLYKIPSDMNSDVQSSFNSLHNSILLSLHPPILITLVFSLLIRKPLVFSNSFRVDMLALMEFSLAFVINVVSSAYWEILCSCLYRVSPSMFLLDLMA